ncbi:hypothetical protein AB1Y20_003714 [Prymnesium parvum]|uniref:Pentatricopeptide repeat-containing protein-mitochondrial domain-containing protein n=1 Tax=Prymnesium parvum TaxID=97485 RepID=A0AB34J815_PRYPA
MPPHGMSLPSLTETRPPRVSLRHNFVMSVISPSASGSRAFSSLMRSLHTPAARASFSVAVGTAQGLGYASAAALLHRTLTTRASPPTASVAAKVDGSTLRPALRAVNGRLVNRLLLQMREGGGRVSRATVLRAHRSAAGLGQPNLCVELIDAFRQTRAPPCAEFAVDVINQLGDVWSPAESGMIPHLVYAERSRISQRWGLRFKTVMVAFEVARDVSLPPLPSDGAHDDGAHDGRADGSWTARLHEQPRVLNALLRTCALSGDTRRAASLYRLASSRGTPLEQRSLSAFLEALCAAGMVQQAFATWETMTQLGLRVRPRTLVPLLRAIACRGDSDDEQAHRELEQLYSTRLPGQGCAPEIELIRAYSAVGDLSTALRVYHHALSHRVTVPPQCRGVDERVQLLGAALFACAACADSPTALSLFHAALQSGVAPDVVTVNTLLRALSSDADRHAASGAPFDRLRTGFALLVAFAARRAVDEVGVLTLLHGCASLPDARMALEVHAWAEAHGLLPAATLAQRGRAADHLFGALRPTGAPREEPPPPRLLSEAIRVYVKLLSLDAPFDARRAGGVLLLRALHASMLSDAALLLSRGAERGVLLAPSEEEQAEWVQAMAKAGGFKGEGRFEAALALVRCFEAQRAHAHWAAAAAAAQQGAARRRGSALVAALRTGRRRPVERVPLNRRSALVRPSKSLLQLWLEGGAPPLLGGGARAAAEDGGAEGERGSSASGGAEALEQASSAEGRPWQPQEQLDAAERRRQGSSAAPCADLDSAPVTVQLLVEQINSPILRTFRADLFELISTMNHGSSSLWAIDSESRSGC